MAWKKTTASTLAVTVVAAQTLLGAGAILVPGQASAEEASAPLKIRIMDTTDVHTNVMDYDYFKNAPSLTVGLDKTATLVTYAREENPNSLLFDNGDLLQGTPLGTYMAKVDKLADPDSVHPMYKAMNLMKYDAATFGNHEFNYGLDFLDKAKDKAQFPYVNANIYKDNGADGDSSNDTENMYTPYIILNKTFKDEAGNDQQVKVGVIGLVTPQIMEWDKVNLLGKVTTKDIAETAAQFVPKIKDEGADIVVALAHTGFDAGAVSGDMSENAVNALSKVPGIDAIAFSHTHKVFPTVDDKSLDGSFKGSDGKLLSVIDNVYGRINNVPAVQAGYGGSNLGIIDLTLEKNSENKWTVKGSKSSTLAIYDKITKTSLADPDPAIAAAVQAEHAATIAYTGQELGQTTAPINSYFAMVQDDPSIQIVTNAQKWYVEKYIQEKLPQYKDLPVLSVGAPFKAGRNGPSEYTDIAAGPLTIRSASDLYLYDNTLKAIKLKGSTVKEWLEMSAGAFNQIDPAITDEQPLLNSKFAVYNFDVIDGVTYQIDVTKKAKYNTDGTINDAGSSRIVNLKYNGQPVDPNQDFIVVTNNYRAGGGGNFPGVKGSELVVDSQDENRQVLMDFIAEEKSINPSADGNWSIAPVQGSNVNVTFTSAPEAEKYTAGTNGKITFTGKFNDLNFGIFNIDLNRSDMDNSIDVHILGINDFHGQLDTTSIVGGKPVGTAATLAAYLKSLRAAYPYSLLVHNGDSVGATAPVSSLERDEPTLEWMNMMKFDVGTLGNHEFDQGVAALKAQLYGGKDPKNEAIVHKGVDFPYVNANVVDEKTNEPIIEPYVIKEIGGVKIGFIGVVTMATVTKVSPEGLKGVKLVEQAPVVNKAVEELKAKGVKTIVVLAHDPATTRGDATTGEAADLAKAIDPEVDVVLAGDNHAMANGIVNGKLVVQAYSYGTAFEDVKLTIDKTTGDVISKSAVVTTTFQDGVTPDAESVALVNKYLDKHPELKQPVGTTDGTITRKDAYIQESSLGNLIADAMRTAFPGSDFAFMNPGGIRADLPTGNVTFGDLAKIQPFGNTLVKLTLTGKQIRTLLQQQWGTKADGTPDTKTLQISGLKYTAYMKSPVNDRVDALTKSDGTPIYDDQYYTAVVNNFMAAGGDNYKVLTEAKEAVVGPNDLDVFYDYIKNTFKGGKITAPIEGRITNKDEEKPAPSSTYTPSAPTVPVTPPAGAVFSEKDIPKPVDGVVTLDVKFPQGANDGSISLPRSISDLVGKGGKLKLNIGSVTVAVPASVLAKAAELAPADKATGSILTFTTAGLAADAVSKLTTAASTSNVAVKGAGAVTQLALSVNAADGTVIGNVYSFGEPLSVSVKLDSFADAKLAGIYRIGDKGELTYIKAKLNDGILTASVTEPGTYGALTYDKTYRDVSASHWAYQIIKELTAKHLVQGMTANNFSPQKPVTRAEFVNMLVNEFGLKASSSPAPFTDVQAGSWYSSAVNAAYSSGLILGSGTGSFNPNEVLTREQMAVMLHRIPALASGKSGLPGFKDAGGISSWAKASVDVIAGAGIMQGRGAELFAPKAVTTRAEAVKVLANLLVTADNGGGFTISAN
nr:bifunctional 2',3'-cyclic-nucleotide 2'-phosphodiesterase/3'-nucleotidase [Paenibacillus beijingensis]